ncbi:hypothetical protein [Methyloradius palustris]|nr:hypothetical protein [Methyloradius palustris]
MAITFHPNESPEYMKKTTTLAVLSMLFAASLSMSYAAAEDAGSDIEAVTASGDKVILQPNGRWKFVEKEKAVVAEKISKQYVENQGCPNGTQGGFFGLGVGRCIKPGDKDFNRGTLNPK